MVKIINNKELRASMKKIVFVLLCLGALPVWAMDIHYFGSMDASRHTIEDKGNRKDVVFDEITNNWSFSNRLTAGLNVSTQVDENSQALVQFLHNQDERSIGVDLLQYQRNIGDGFRVRLGKQRLPNYLFSEVIQVNALLPWVSAPYEVYSKIIIRSFTGASVEKSFGPLLISVFGGDSQENYKTAEVVEYNVSTRDFRGARIGLTSESYEVFATYVATTVDLQVSQDVQTSTTGVFAKSKQGFSLPSFEAWTFGGQKRWQDFSFLGEYVSFRSGDASIKSGDAAYGTLGYGLTENLTSYLTYSTDISKESYLSPSKQSTYTLGLNHKLNMNVVLKISASHVDFRQKSVSTPLAGMPTSTGYLGYTKTPSENFQLYQAQVAFVF